MIGGETKRVRYSSSGGLTRWFKRIFTKDGSSNRTSTFTEQQESYTPLRADHEHDHDHDEEQDDDDDDIEEYEMIKRDPGHES